MSKAIEFKPKRTEHFEKEGSRYVYSESVALAVRVALAAGRPLLVRGAPGSGKSTLAKNVALTLGFRYREAVVTSRTQARDLLYRFDSLRRLQDAHANALKPDGEYVRPAVFWWAFDASSANERTPPAAQEPAPDKPCVVLIDEIDKADPDVPNDLLIPLGENRFEVEETGKVVRAVTPPFVVLTTNDERSLPPAFLRRCVVLNLERPDLVEVARLHLGDGKNDVALYKTVAAQQQEIEARMRERGLRAPSTAEYLDTVRACQQLGVDRLADIAALTLEKERADDVP